MGSIFKTLLARAMIVVPTSYADHEPDGCDADDNACMAHLLSDVSDSNDTAILGLVAVGFGAYYLLVDKSKDEKKEFFLCMLMACQKIFLHQQFLRGNYHIFALLNLSGSYLFFIVINLAKKK